MAQYDLLLTQNVAAAGIEFSEKYALLHHGSILTGQNASGGDPTVLNPASGEADLNKILKLITDGAGGVKLGWAVQEAGHTQNTDTGTTSQTFQLHSGDGGGVVKAESTTKFGLRNAADSAYNDLQVKDLTAASAALTTGTITTAPSGDTDITNKLYVDGLLAANDAMLFKGTVGVGGTYEIAAFNSLATYNVGWTYKVVTAGTIKGKVCEIGDMLIALVTRAGSGNVDADWTVVQANIDGAVIKSGDLVNNSMVVGAGASSVKDLPLAANSVVVALTANTPSALAVAASRIIGRGASGDIAALDADAVKTILGTMPIEWVTAPVTKTSAGTAGQAAYDTNFLYICTGTDVWKRSAIATNW